MNDVSLHDDTPDVNDVEDTSSVDTHQKDSDTVTVDLYVANEGKVARTGGPYLDDVERRNAETWRAQKEGRDPDYDKPPATAGTVLVPKSQLVERDTDKSHYSDAVEVEVEPFDTVEVQVATNEPDPAQGNWDNDSDRLKALQGAQAYEELTGKPLQEPTPVAVSGGDLPRSDYANNSEEAGDDSTDTEVKPGENEWNGPNATGDTVNH